MTTPCPTRAAPSGLQASTAAARSSVARTMAAGSAGVTVRCRASARRAERMRREEKREEGFGYDALPKTPRRDLFASSAAEDSTQKDAGDSDDDGDSSGNGAWAGDLAV